MLSVATSSTGRPRTRAHSPRSILVWSTLSFTFSDSAFTVPSPSISIFEWDFASPSKWSDASELDHSIETDIFRTTFDQITIAPHRNTAPAERIKCRSYSPSFSGTNTYFKHSPFPIWKVIRASSPVSRTWGRWWSIFGFSHCICRSIEREIKMAKGNLWKLVKNLVL